MTENRAMNESPSKNHVTRAATDLRNKVFVPFSEALVDEVGFNLGDLVPFQLAYECVRLEHDGSETRLRYVRDEALAALD